MRRNKLRVFALWLWVLPWGPATAQQTSPTVATLIDAIKTQREQALSPKPAPEQSRAQASTAQALAHAPLLWSISGVNEELHAVLVVDRRVYTVHKQGLPQRAGAWQVRHIDTQKVCIHKGAHTMCLTPPDRSASVLPFLQALRPAEGPLPSASAPPAAAAVDDTLARALASRLPTMPLTGGGKK
jgi:hypothetical protein